MKDWHVYGFPIVSDVLLLNIKLCCCAPGTFLAHQSVLLTWVKFSSNLAKQSSFQKINKITGHPQKDRQTLILCSAHIRRCSKNCKKKKGTVYNLRWSSDPGADPSKLRQMTKRLAPLPRSSQIWGLNQASGLHVWSLHASVLAWAFFMNCCRL